MLALTVISINSMKKIFLLTIFAFLLVSCAQSKLPLQELPVIEEEAGLPEAFNQPEPQDTFSSTFSKDEQSAEDTSTEPENNTVLDAFSPPDSSTDDGQGPIIFAVPMADSLCYYGCSETRFDVAESPE